MTRDRLAVLGMLLVILACGEEASADVSFLWVHASDGKGSPLSGIQIGAVRGSMEKTANDGKARIALSQGVPTNERVELQLGQDSSQVWLIISPHDRRVRASGAADPDPIVLERRGSDALLKSEEALRNAIRDLRAAIEEAHGATQQAAGRDPSVALAAKAEEYGVAVPRLDHALRSFSDRASNPVDKELGAYYGRTFSVSIRWVRTSAEHRAIFIQTYRLALTELKKLAVGLRPGSWAVSLNADETILDSSAFQVDSEESQRVFDMQKWTAWIERAEAPPQPGAVAFLSAVHELGGVIAIVTNRLEAQRAATEINLRNAGLPFDLVLCRTAVMRSDKTSRWKSLELGTASKDLPPLKIVMWVGASVADFPSLDQSLRSRGEKDFEEFGTRFFLLPNPMYGAFERNRMQ